jgi:hypothetical protein
MILILYLYYVDVTVTNNTLLDNNHLLTAFPARSTVLIEAQAKIIRPTRPQIRPSDLTTLQDLTTSLLLESNLPVWYIPLGTKKQHLGRSDIQLLVVSF